MSANAQFEGTLRRYVLGDLEEDARLQLEERLVTSPEAFDSLGVVEDALIEDYLDGVLPAEAQAGFERAFLRDPAREWQVRFVRLLRNRAFADDTRGAASAMASAAHRAGSRWSLAAMSGSLRLQPAWRLALAAAMTVLVTGNIWYAVQGARLAREVDRLRSDQAFEEGKRRQLEARVQELSAGARVREELLRSAARPDDAAVGASSRPAATPTGPGVRAMPTFALATGVLRGEGAMTRIAIPAGADFVRLRLSVPAIEYPLYRAALEDADGTEIWVHSRLRARSTAGATVTVVVPAEALVPGDYQLRLSGSDGRGTTERVGAYSFRVTGAR